jgi:hypothetical protein
MLQRGRKSGAQLLALPLTERGPELEPPPQLAPEAARIWTEVMRSRARTFTPFEARVLLAVYCCHTVSMNLLSARIATLQASDDPPTPLLDRLLAMRNRESAAVLRLQTRLRMLPSRSEAPLPPTVPWMQDGR